MNMYRQELRMARGTMFAWCFGLLLVTAMFVSIFPAFHADVEASRKILNGVPEQLRQAMGINLTTFFSFLGFYAYTFTYVGLAGAVQAMNLGLTMLSREVSNKTTDFLLTKPVRRSEIFFSKLFAALTILVVTNIVLVGGTLTLASIANSGIFDMKIFSLLCLAFFIVQLMFMSIGIFVSQVLRVRSVITLSLAFTFGFFAIGMLQSLSNDTTLRYLSPFKYFDHLKIVENGTYETAFLAAATAVIIAPLIIAYGVYIRRDARSVT